MRSSFLNVDGIRTHYLEAGRGMDVAFCSGLLFLAVHTRLKSGN
jgi:hypothetical protein